MFEPAVPGAVTDDVGRLFAPNRLSRRAPHLACVVIADIDGFADRVAHRIVRPWGELVLAAVLRPCVAGPGLGDLEAERLVGDDVQPRRRSGLARTEDGDVFAPVRGKAAETIEELEVRARCGRFDLGRPHSGERGGRSDDLGSLQANDLIDQAASAAEQDGPGSTLQQRSVGVRELVTAQDVDPAAAVVAVLDEDRLTCPHEGFERVVEVLDVCRPVLVDDHKVDVDELQSPVLVGPEQLSYDLEVLGFVDAHQHDRQIAGDPVRPQAGGGPVVAGQEACCWS